MTQQVGLHDDRPSNAARTGVRECQSGGRDRSRTQTPANHVQRNRMRFPGRRWLITLGGALLAAQLAACSAAPAANSPETITSIASSTGAPDRDEFAVMIGEQKVAVSCAGTNSGKPTIVLLHANGGNGQFGLVLPHLLTLSRVCVYDRPGTGSSPTPPKLPRPVHELVAEAHAVVSTAKIPSPVFLIGASEGAALALMYAQAYPDQVAGFVSINPSPPYKQWIAAAKQVETPDEVATLEESDFRGENPEQVDNRGNSSMLDQSLPDSIPYAVMFDETCDGDTAFCSKVYEPLRALTEQLAHVGTGGHFVALPGAGHEIASTRPDEVNKTVDQVWIAAAES